MVEPVFPPHWTDPGRSHLKALPFWDVCLHPVYIFSLSFKFRVFFSIKSEMKGIFRQPEQNWWVQLDPVLQGSCPWQVMCPTRAGPSHWVLAKAWASWWKSCACLPGWWLHWSFLPNVCTPFVHQVEKVASMGHRGRVGSLRKCFMSHWCRRNPHSRSGQHKPVHSAHPNTRHFDN